MGTVARDTVITLGDNAYPRGSQANFEECYDPTWGRYKDRTRPAPGNHEYYTDEAEGYFEYFGEAAGDPDEGYYSYDIGRWHIVALNSNCEEIRGCADKGPQAEWLKADLAASSATLDTRTVTAGCRIVAALAAIYCSAVREGRGDSFMHAEVLRRALA